MRFLAPQLPAVPRIAKRFEAAESKRWFSNSGPCYEEFSRALEDWIGGGIHCIPVANATLALMLSLRATVGRSLRRQVLLPAYTFAATAVAVEWVGLEPVFVDVEPSGWHLDSEQLERALEARGDDVAAILACSTFGTPPAVEQSARWRELAEAYGVPLVVDSAAGFGGLDEEGLPLGHQGDAEIFSFHATKPLAIGEGGMVATADAELAHRVRELANFGFRAGVIGDPPGLNAKLAEWPAATGLVALEDLPNVLATRRGAAAELRSSLESLGFTFQHGCVGSTWQFVPVLAPSNEMRTAVRDRAAADGIEFRAYYDVPLHRMPAFASAQRIGELPVTCELAARTLSLPMANDQSDADRARIMDVVRQAV